MCGRTAEDWQVLTIGVEASCGTALVSGSLFIRPIYAVLADKILVKATVDAFLAAEGEFLVIRQEFADDVLAIV